MNINKIIKALEFCTKFHDGQYRSEKRNVGCLPRKEPYATHPIRVFLFLREVIGIDDDTILCASLMHDLIEDTECSYQDIVDAFGADIADTVQELTNDESLPTPEKKQKMLEKVKTISMRAKIIKGADRVDNLRDLVNSFKPEKAKKYLHESEQLCINLLINEDSSSNLYKSFNSVIGALTLMIYETKKKIEG